MKWLQPWKKNIIQRLVPPKKATIIVYCVVKVIDGIAALSGNEKSPLEYRYNRPIIAAANAPTTSIA